MSIFTRFRRYLWRIACDWIFDVRVREELCRQEFFYNAFRALSFNGIDGDYAEFGCHGGRTFAMAYHEARRFRHRARLWAFDSFEGLPVGDTPDDEHPQWTPGRLATSLDRFHAICAVRGIPRQDYSVVAGFYDESLTQLSESDAPSNIALAYIDCDLHASTKTVLEFLAPRMKHGMIVAFDDYFCWSESRAAGERLALIDFQRANTMWTWVPYMNFGWHGLAFVLEDRGRSQNAQG